MGKQLVIKGADFSANALKVEGYHWYSDLFSNTSQVGANFGSGSVDNNFLGFGLYTPDCPGMSSDFKVNCLRIRLVSAQPLSGQYALHLVDYTDPNNIVITRKIKTFKPVNQEYIDHYCIVKLDNTVILNANKSITIGGDDLVLPTDNANYAVANIANFAGFNPDRPANTTITIRPTYTPCVDFGYTII